MTSLSGTLFFQDKGFELGGVGKIMHIKAKIPDIDAFAEGRAFTLIELLVVISIIGLLASIIFASLNATRSKSRDARRRADLRLLVNGLELFFNEYGVYPCGDANAQVHNGTSDSSNSTPFLNGKKEGSSPPTNCIGAPDFGLLTAGFVSNPLIKDPINDRPYLYWYTVNRNRDTYLLYAVLESDTQSAATDGGLCDNYFEIGNGTGLIMPDRTSWIGVSCN